MTDPGRATKSFSAITFSLVGFLFLVEMTSGTLQGFCTVWLPLNVALVFDRGRRSSTGASSTRPAAGMLVVGLQAGAILGALGGRALFEALAENVTFTLFAPAIAVTVAFFVILGGVRSRSRSPAASSTSGA